MASSSSFYLLGSTLLALLLSCAPPSTPPPLSQVSSQAPAGPALTSPIREIQGQTVYVPVYSHIYVRDETRTFDLTVTLSVRNTDSERSLDLLGVRYYDTAGGLLHTYVA